MSVVHRITAYDGRGKLTLEHDVPSDQMDSIKILANVDAGDKEAIASYPIQPNNLHEVARILKKSIDGDKYSWFLEPFSEN